MGWVGCRTIIDTISATKHGNVWRGNCRGHRGQWGGIAQDNRRFINGVFWILRTGAPWRNLPPDYGDWKNTHRRFCRWRDKGVWEKLLETLLEESELKWLMIDASHIKVHPHGTGARGGNQEMGRTKGDSTQSCILPWMHMVSRSGPNSPPEL